MASKAWIYNHEGYPRALRQTGLPVSDALAPNELRISIKAAAINPVDIQLMNFPLWPYLPSVLASPTHPVAEDFSGIVEAAGKDTGYKPGDAVLGMIPILSTGTLQQTITISTATSTIVPKPSSWSFAQAASLPLVWLTARTAISAVQPWTSSMHPSQPPKIVVLGGSSATGMYTIYLAHRRGWKVLASCSGKNADFVRFMGADQVVDYTTSSVPDAVRKYGPDAIVDCVGGTECLGLASRYVTIVGDKTSRAQMGGVATMLWSPKQVLRSLAGKAGLGQSYDVINLEMKKSYLEEALNLPVEKIAVDSEFGFDQVKEAFERLNTGRARGKVVVKVAD